MAAPEYREIWVPLENSTDCSQGFCTIYCPQWCYIIFPPPPPFGFDSGQDDSGTSFSPLVIAIIGILASAVLLVSYYTVVSRYCGNWNSMRGHLRRNHRESFNEDHHVSAGESWQIPNSGLEESLIKSITVCKFKRGEGLIEGTDCSVCLSEFQEDESLRLLPKCSHAFHLPCIDRWLQDNSSCPLCRASVVSHILAIPITQMPSTLPEFEIMMSHESLPAENHSPENSSLADVHTEEDVGISGGSGENDSIVTSEIVDDDQSSTGPKISLRAFSHLGTKEISVIAIRHQEIQAVRRSFSMDSSNRNCVSIAGMLTMNHDIESVTGDCERGSLGVESPSNDIGEHSIFRNRLASSRSKILHNVRAQTIMKRSMSSGKFLFSRYGRGRNSILPL